MLASSHESAPPKKYEDMTKEEKQTQNQVRLFFRPNFACAPRERVCDLSLESSAEVCESTESEGGGGARITGLKCGQDEVQGGMATVAAGTGGGGAGRGGRGGGAAGGKRYKSQDHYQQHHSKYLTSEEKMNRIESFLEKEKITNEQSKWKNLNKTVKIQKLNAFAEMYSQENGLNDEEKSLLQKFLKQSLDKEKLKHIKDVSFDKDTGTIKNIPGLTYSKAARHFSLKNLEKRNNEAILKASESLQLSQADQLQIHNQTIRHLSATNVETRERKEENVSTAPKRKKTCKAVHAFTSSDCSIAGSILNTTATTCTKTTSPLFPQQESSLGNFASMEVDELK